MDKLSEKKVFFGTITIVFVRVFAKLAAFISGTILAAYLGTSYQSDAYYMVAGIKDVIYPMLSVGIWKVFLPLYKENLAQQKQGEADTLANKALSFFSLVSGIAVVLMILFASPLVSIVAPGFEGETKELCVRLFRIATPVNLVVVASTVYAAMLQCHNKFFGSQIREVVSHLPTILAALLFYSAFGIEAMAAALVVGGLARLLVEIPFVDWGYKFKADFHFKTKEFLVMLKRLPSALISEGVTQLNTLVDKIMASMLPVGTVSGLSYGHRLMNIFSGLLSSAVATAVYPQMIELIALKKLDELSRLVSKIINVFCVLMFPITVGCILFRIELVSAVFQRGAFDAKSVELTSGIFALYILGVFFIACNRIITNLFYSFGNTRTPMVISIINFGVNVVLNLVFIYFWGVNGLALATSVSALVTFFLQIKAAAYYITFEYRNTLVTALKVLTGAVVACLIPRLFFNYYPINNYLLLVFSAITASVIYFAVIKILHVPEMDYVVGLLVRKIKRKTKK